MSVFEFSKENIDAEIPEGTTEIADYAFFGYAQLETVTIPSTVKVIGSGAFSGCKSLKEITLPLGLEMIENGAFFGCSSLKEAVIPENVKSMGEHVFSSCTSLERVSFPAGISEFGKGMFRGCTSLISIETVGEGKYSGRDGALVEDDGDVKKILTFPQGKNGEYTTPSDISEIAEGAFWGCKNLDKVTLTENVKYIGDRAFANCPYISIVIENKEIETGQLPFEETVNISLSSPKKKKNPYAAFGEVDFEEKLANIKFVLPVSKKFVVPKERWSTEEINGEICITSYNDDETEITTPSKTEDDKVITAVGDYAFSPEKGGIDKRRRDILSNIRSVFLSRNIAKIGTGAFKNCISLEYALVPFGVDYIGERAFSGCKELKNITLPEKLDMIGNGTFFGCKKLENIELPNGINTIGELAFSGCERLTYLTIPEGTKVIGRKAFANCKFLMYVNVPESLEYVGEDAFKNTMWYSGRPAGVIYAGKCAIGYKGNERTVNVKEGTVSVSAGAFMENESLCEVILPDGLKYLGMECFWNCSHLSQANLPESLEEIGERAFSGCRSLKNIHIPGKVTVIGEFAFAGCANVHKVTVPGNVDTIEREAFRDCQTLNCVVIEDGVRSIKDEAFIRCGALTEVYIPDSLTDFGERVFFGLPNAVIRAHKGTEAEKYAEKNHLRFQKV